MDMWSPESPMTAGRSLGEQAYETIRDAIVTLQLEPGTLIYENEMAEQLNISRTPVRDAFSLLIAEQLVEVLPQRNRKVALISVEKVRESSFVRLSLESSAFQVVARQWDDAQEPFRQAEKRIRVLLAEQSESAEQHNVVRFLQLDEAFHTCILELAGNRTLLGVVGQMRGHLNRVRYLAMKELSLTGNLVREHSELFERLLSGDAAGTGIVLDRHLRSLDGELAALRERMPHFFCD